MSRSWSWFGVKTLYRVAPVGRRLASDDAASDTMTLVEERVVLFKARNLRIAVRRAEREARTYATDRHRNPYGQRVRIRYLGYCSAYDLNEPVVDGTEVYSSNDVVHRRISDAAIRKRMIGQLESNLTYALRRNIMDVSFSGALPGIHIVDAAAGLRLTNAERKFSDAVRRRLTSARRRRRARTRGAK